MTIKYLNQQTPHYEIPPIELQIHQAALARSASRRENWLLTCPAYRKELEQ